MRYTTEYYCSEGSKGLPDRPSGKGRHGINVKHWEVKKVKGSGLLDYAREEIS